MTALDHILARLRAHANELRAEGVLHASVFGSVVRGEDRPDSDVDILIDLDPGRPMGLIRYTGIQRQLEEILGRPVDLAERRSLRPFVKSNALREEIDAF